MLVGFVERPEMFIDHVKRFTTSLTTQMIFGFRILTEDDPLPKKLFNISITPELPCDAITLDLTPPLVQSFDRISEICLSLLCFSRYLLQIQEYEGMSDEEAAYTSGSLLHGGLGSTAETLTGFVKAMVMFPNVVRAAQDELDCICGDRMPELDDWPNLAIHNDAERYPNPRVFDPTRWPQDAQTAAQAATNADVSQRDHFAFGTGRRMCQGVHIAERAVDPATGVEIPVPDPEDLQGGMFVMPRPFHANIVPRDEGKARLLLLIVPYRLLLHPLRSYPGPLLAKLTDAYAGVLAVRRCLPLVIWRLHEEHGPVIRLAPNRLLFNTATAFRSIYQNDDRITKAFTYELLTRNRVYSVFNTLDRDAHRSKRKIVGHAFSERSIRSFGPALLSQVDIYLKQLLESSQQPINMTQKMSHLAMDIIAQLALGYDLATQTSEENRFFARSMTVSFYVGNISHHFPAFHKVHTNRVFDTIFYETREKFIRLLEKMVRSRLALDTHAKSDFFSFVAHELPNEAAKTRDSVVWKEAMVFLVAGGDTVMTAMTAVFFYLSRNKSCYARLSDEIRSTFSSGRDIKGGPQLASCRYLRACIDEALRMSPPISANLWRQQVATDKEPLIIDGHHIPRGTLFGVNVYALSHNPAIFPEPFEYKPERWLPSSSADPVVVESEEAARKSMYEAFASFSIGPRNCVGKPLAYLETSITIAKTLWYFDFEPAPGPLGSIGEGNDRGRPGEFCTQDGFNSTHDGPFLVFNARESTLLERDLEMSA
ncbi:Isotrichodermin C-15 hydroxylase [Cytospora mali]|uniref:Isotrichodermin C-15 hydroxylase n=1 Tax=Cytospora mali TaxID=578113 RepID=A0A194WDB5_CYTMA|nr:Isotrichodermin C-15 hydroxylase [Valsa mali]